MLITHYNVKNTFLTEESFITINKKVHFIKTMFRKYCEQTKLNFSLNYDNRQNIIIGKFELSSSSAYNYGLYSKLIFYLNEADDYIMIVNMINPSKREIIDLLIYILLDTQSIQNTITNFKIRHRISLQTSEIVNITQENRKEFLERYYLKNILNELKLVCNESFLTRKDLTQRTGHEIPLFKITDINSRGQNVISYSRSVKARRKLNSHELDRNYTPRKVKRMFNSSPTKKNSFKVKSLDKDKVRQVLETRKRAFLERDIKTSKRRTRESNSEMDEGDVNIGLLIITMHGSIPYYKERLGQGGFSLFKIKDDKFENVYYRSSTKIGLYSFYDKPHPNSPTISPNNDSDDEYEYVNKSRLSEVTSHLQRNSIRFSHKNKRNIYEKCFKKTHNKLKFYKYFFNCGLDFLSTHKKSLRNQSRRPTGYKVTTLYDEDNDEKRYLEDIVDNGKIDYYINKTYSNDPDTPDGIKDTQHKLKFIFYNTSTKRYEKYDLIDEADFIKYCHIFGIDMVNNPVVKMYLSKIRNTNNIKIISMVFILNMLAFLNLKYLYIYDESCSSYEFDPRLIHYYTEVSEPRMTIAEIDKEITKEIYDAVQLKMDEENKKVGI